MTDVLIYFIVCFTIAAILLGIVQSIYETKKLTRDVYDDLIVSSVGVALTWIISIPIICTLFIFFTIYIFTKKLIDKQINRIK